MQELGLRPRNFISGNICFEFSVYCLCSAARLDSRFDLNLTQMDVNKGVLCHALVSIFIHVYSSIQKYLA
jgi:hypothetical protein